VAAVTSQGVGTFSSLSNLVTPLGVASAPGDVAATAGAGSATVTCGHRHKRYRDRAHSRHDIYVHNRSRHRHPGATRWGSGRPSFTSGTSPARTPCSSRWLTGNHRTRTWWSTSALKPDCARPRLACWLNWEVSAAMVGSKIQLSALPTPPGWGSR